MKMVTRDQVVAEARSWIGTKFVHGAGVKGAGCDCAHLVSEVYVKLGLIPPFEYPIYGPDFFRHGEDQEKFIIAHLKTVCREVTESEAGPGDTAVVKFGRVYSHCVILTGHGWGIQAWPSASRVSEINLREESLWRSRDRRYFSPFKETV